MLWYRQRFVTLLTLFSNSIAMSSKLGYFLLAALLVCHVCFARVQPDINEVLSQKLAAIQDALEDIPDEVPQIMSRAGDCTIGMNNGDLGDKQPLILKAGTSTFEIPSEAGYITVANGNSVDLYCTSNFAAPLSGKKVIAYCDGGNVFKVDGNLLSIQSIVCTSAVAHTTRTTTRTCSGGASILEVGFAVDVGFLPTIEVCHDFGQEVTLYSHYSLGPSNVAFQKSVSRPSFVTGGLYNGQDVNKMYTQVAQMATFAQILGAGSTKYFDLPKNVFLARGHMAAKADFIFAPPQLATFYFINAAPQWQTFNAGNWERVEDGVKQFASARKANFDVYTGTWGVATLPDDRGIQQPLYLTFSSSGQGLIPVPKIYYRVVIDTATRLGIVLIGVNNPHITLEEIQKDYVICNDVSDKINWISWDKTNILKGYSYACEVNEFASKIGQLPALGVSGLLY